MNFLKRFSLIFLSVLILLNSFLLSEQMQTISKIVEKNGNAVVMIAIVKEKEGGAGLGSGFIVSSTGVIITNYHVIRGAYPAFVKLTNGDIYDDISIIDTDVRRDIAIIKINGWNLPFAKLGNSDAAKIGERIVVIGNPKGLENTVSDGLISATRDTEEGFKMHQISAPISEGSSGSPIFNMEGLVIGIATSSIIEGQNLNFSVPINYARGMIREETQMTLEEFSKMSEERVPMRLEDLGAFNLRGFLIDLNEIIIKMYKGFDRFIYGMHVSFEPYFKPAKINKPIDPSTFKVSPYIYYAKETFNNVYEEITKLNCNNNEEYEVLNNYESLLLKANEGMNLTVKGLDANNQRLVTEGMMKLILVFNDIAQPANRRFISCVEKYYPELKEKILPVVLLSISAEAEFPVYFGIKYLLAAKKVAINFVDFNSPAYRANLKVGDEILEIVNGEKFFSIIDLERFLRKCKPGDTVNFLVKRKEKVFSVSVKLEVAKDFY